MSALNGKPKSVLDDPEWLNTYAKWRLYGIQRDGMVWCLETFSGTYQTANERARYRVEADTRNRFCSWFLEMHQH
jgi:hypothetical protein